ncbi:hypothetical protein U9M48_004939 [Paspalum notatum var. saurae]|uniref:RNase H type-1 domain-containing protein n=1 Tax=Paspalum notatum var. saurae TaxID=547442 RepID=A0AAQ3SL60_PASNO
MSCFDLTKGLCDGLSSMIGKYWWSNQDKVNKIHWIGWQKLTRSKSIEGLGFRDLYAFNMAMQARQGCHLITQTDSLCARVLRAKYFPLSDVLEARAKNGISYTWCSVLKGLHLLREVIIWRIGDGSQVNIWADPWIPRGETTRVITPRNGSLLHKVADLIDPVTGSWDYRLVRDTFLQEDADCILAIPIQEGMEDTLAWHGDPNGKFSVKSAYALVVRRNADASSSTSMQGENIWKSIWNVNVTNKIKMFLWRLAHNSHPVRANIARRGAKIDTLCPMCSRFDEDCGHLFFKCKKVKHVWRSLCLEDIRLLLTSKASALEVIESILALHEEIKIKVVLLLWCWWSARNKANQGERCSSTEEVCSSVTYHLMSMEKLQKSTSARAPSLNLKWQPPPAGSYKINCDGSYLSNSGLGGWGCIVRDHDGAFLAVEAGALTGLSSALHAETVACMKGLELAAFLGMQNVLIETDAKILKTALTSQEYDLSALGVLFKEIKSRMLSEFESRVSLYYEDKRGNTYPVFV